MYFFFMGVALSASQKKISPLSASQKIYSLTIRQSIKKSAKYSSLSAEFPRHFQDISKTFRKSTV
jgi:hypothetical protein